MKCHVSKSIDFKNILKNIQSFPLLWFFSAEAKGKERTPDTTRSPLAYLLPSGVVICYYGVGGGGKGTPENLKI